MVSKTLFLLIALAFATLLLITSQVDAAKDLASNHDTNEVEDAKYGGGYNNGGGRGGYYNGSGGHGRSGHGRGYCRYGCCGRNYNRGCRCCTTLQEATAYKQAHQTQTHN